MIKEFKQFISKGNVIDLAVGVVIGSSFGKIVSSLVDNIIMPLIGLLVGGINFSNLSFTLKNVKIEYGLFLQNVVNFLIVAFCIFIVIKAFNKVVHKKEEKLKEKKSNEILLLEEIRDLLKSNKKT